MNNISVMIMETYVAEASALRVQKMENMKGSAAIELYKDMLDVLVYDSAAKIRKSAMDAIYSFATPSDALKLANAADVLTKVAGVNVKEARRKIANRLIEDNCYKF
jgi:hypothetical protein